MRRNVVSDSEAQAYLGTLGLSHAKFQEAGTKNPFRQGDVTCAKSAEALDYWTGPRGERLKGESKAEAANDRDAARGHGTRSRARPSYHSSAMIKKGLRPFRRRGASRRRAGRPGRSCG